MIFSLFQFVFETLTSTVSGRSEAGYGQICGQKPLPEISGKRICLCDCSLQCGINQVLSFQNLHRYKQRRALHMSAIQRPPMIPMINHKPRLSSVDADVFTGDEACLA